MTTAITSNTVPKRILFVLWKGDYRLAYERIVADGTEDYYAQLYSIESVAAIGDRFGCVGQLTIVSDEAEDIVLPNGVRAMAAGADVSTDLNEVIHCIEKFDPTDVVLATPKAKIIRWCLTNRVNVLPMLADSLNTAGNNSGWFRHQLSAARHSYQVRQLVRSLRDPRVRWIGNHNVPACQQLVDVGIDAAKVIPWDWPPVVCPSDHAPKTLTNNNGQPYRLVFVGKIKEVKGVGDLLHAVKAMKMCGFSTVVTFIGSGEIDRFKGEADQLGIADQCTFVGRMAHADTIVAVRDADLAVVPSRHDYPEGLPMTIYEALAVRTPLVLSDHPMFDRVSQQVETVATFSAGNPDALADAVRSVLDDSKAYARMSQRSAEAWEHIRCPVRFYDLVERWLGNTEADDHWLSRYAMNCEPSIGTGAA